MNVWHMSGAGNTFAVLDARGRTLDFPKIAKSLCAQLKADGLLAVDTSEIADFRLHFYNADGTRGEMCGNGARCVCKFAYDQGIAGENMTVQTDAGLVYGQKIDSESYRVQLNNPQVLDLHRLEGTAYVELGNPGVPHSVTKCEGLEFSQKEALRTQFLQLRHSSAFPKGVNVNFYSWLGENRIRVLTYERGVENFTLACGTGSASVAVVLWVTGQLPGGVLKAENQGGLLKVEIVGKAPSIEKIYLEGPAVLLGEYTSIEEITL